MGGLPLAERRAKERRVVLALEHATRGCRARTHREARKIGTRAMGAREGNLGRAAAGSKFGSWAGGRRLAPKMSGLRGSGDEREGAKD